MFFFLPAGIFYFFHLRIVPWDHITRSPVTSSHGHFSASTEKQPLSLTRILLFQQKYPIWRCPCSYGAGLRGWQDSTKIHRSCQWLFTKRLVQSVFTSSFNSQCISMAQHTGESTINQYKKSHKQSVHNTTKHEYTFSKPLHLTCKLTQYQNTRRTLLVVSKTTQLPNKLKSRLQMARNALPLLCSQPVGGDMHTQLCERQYIVEEEGDGAFKP